METAKIESLIGFAWLTIITISAVIYFFHQHYKISALRFEKEKEKLEQDKLIAALHAEKEKQLVAFSAAVEAEEEQKARIANNLHDEILHLLIAVKQNVDQQEEPNIGVSELVAQTILGIKRIALELIPKVLLKYGLIKALEQHLSYLKGNEEITIELENNTNFGNETPFSKKAEVHVYRICLEILSNLLKHAGFSYLQVSIENSDQNLIIEFRHNGQSTTNNDIEMYTETTNGLGLKSLQSRLLILNATINYSTELETAIINLTIPFSI